MSKVMSASVEMSQKTIFFKFEDERVIEIMGKKELSSLTEEEKKRVYSNLEALADIYNNRHFNGFDKAFNPSFCEYLTEDELCGALLAWREHDNFSEGDFSEFLPNFINYAMILGYRFKGLDKDGNPKRKIPSRNLMRLLMFSAEAININPLVLAGACFLYKYLRSMTAKEGIEYMDRNFVFVKEPSKNSFNFLAQTLNDIVI